MDLFLDLHLAGSCVGAVPFLHRLCCWTGQSGSLTEVLELHSIYNVVMLSPVGGESENFVDYQADSPRHVVSAFKYHSMHFLHDNDCIGAYLPPNGQL